MSPSHAQPESARVCIVVVTHNSERVIDDCIDSIMNQSVPPGEVVIVDSGSDDTHYLDSQEARENVTVHRVGNIGFGAANNYGIAHCKKPFDFLLLANPDTILAPDCLESCLSTMTSRPDVEVMTGLLLGYDVGSRKPTELCDSTGVYRMWYGRWRDRDQGVSVSRVHRAAGEVEALCGALIWMRRSAVEPWLPSLFDEDFFLYKEDIELSLRLKKSGRRLWYFPEIRAYHGRGWGDSRSSMSRQARLQAAGSEIILYRKHPSPYILWAMTKFALVKFFDL